jgi:hypothetical protein
MTQSAYLKDACGEVYYHSQYGSFSLLCLLGDSEASLLYERALRYLKESKKIMPFTEIKRLSKGEYHMSERYLVPEEMAKRRQLKRNIFLATFCVVVIVISALVPFLANKI